MIIACPACQTRYVVPDSAIGVEGRTVRCAKCKHSWFQDGPDAQRPAERDDTLSASVPDGDTGVLPEEQRDDGASDGEAQAGTLPEGAASEPKVNAFAPPARNMPPDETPRSAHVTPAEPSSVGEAGSPAGHGDGGSAIRDFHETEPPSYTRDDRPPLPPVTPDDDNAAVSHFDHAPPFGPRRNTVRLWTWAAAIFAVLALSVVATINFAGTPGWWPSRSSEWGQAQPDLQLSFPPDQQSWRELSNRTRLFSARVVVKNTSREVRELPPVLIKMLDERERQVFSWVVQPPQPNLAPGETVTIDEARTDVPRNAVFADVGWAPL